LLAQKPGFGRAFVCFLILRIVAFETAPDHI
jgi:hypothetical protein